MLSVLFILVLNKCSLSNLLYFQFSISNGYWWRRVQALCTDPQPPASQLPPGIWKVLAQVFWTTGGNINETKSISKNMVNITPSHRPLTSELVRVSPLKQNKTQCRDEFRSLSGSVTEILTACRMHKILIAWCQIEAEIRGFPTMYINGGGVNIVKIGEKRDFVQILGLKTPISSDRNFEHLTLEGSVAWNF